MHSWFKNRHGPNYSKTKLDLEATEVFMHHTNVRCPNIATLTAKRRSFLNLASLGFVYICFKTLNACAHEEKTLCQYDACYN